jgi:hypothetical protein
MFSVETRTLCNAKHRPRNALLPLETGTLVRGSYLRHATAARIIMLDS